MKRIFLFCLTVFLCLSTFAAPKYLVQTGKSGDATWAESVATHHSSTIIDLTVLNKSLDEWINETFDEASKGKETWLAAGTYAISSGITRGFASIKLYGGFAGIETLANQRAIGDEPWEMTNATIIDADAKQLYSVESQTLWDGLTITNSQAEGNGGVAKITNNAVIRNCRFVGNTSTDKGGVLYSYQRTNIQVSKCYFENNSSVRGGAVFVQGSTGNTYSLTNCTFKDNNATGTGSGDGGGAVCFTSNGDFTVNACVFDHNNAYRGPAFLCSSTGSGINITISNCLFINQQNADKHAVYILKGAVLNCTFARNAGGAVYMSGGEGSSGRIENNIVWGDNDDECKISITNTASYTLKNNALFKMYDPSNVDKADNKRLYASESDYFVDDANGDYHLSWKAKKMIGKGLDLTSDGITTDLEGASRTANDIGCYAFNGEIYARSVTADTYGTLCTPKAVNAGEFEGATFYRIAGTASGGSELAIETVDALEAGHSYIFESTSTLIRLNLTGEAATEPIADNGLYGTYHTIENLEDYLAEQSIAYNHIYVVYEGEIRRAGTNLDVPAKRAWIKLDEVRDAATEPVASGAVRKRIPNASYVPTTLEEVSEINGTEAIYDLLGRHVTTPVMGGVYIVNGEKIIIK